MKRSHPPPLAYGAILFVGAAVSTFLLSHNGSITSYSDFTFRRGLSEGSLFSLKDAEKYSNLQDVSDIDYSIEERAQANNAKDKCSRLLLYLPDMFADHGHGSQINNYIMGVTTSTYLDRAMLLVEPPVEINTYAGGSQFGCPIDAFRETMTQTSSLRHQQANWNVASDFPLGFSRLVEHPSWLSHGCEVPCSGTHSYKDWRKLSIHWNEITCTNPDGTEVNVVVSGGSHIRAHFRKQESSMTLGHPSPAAEKWATNLGATPGEAEIFSDLKDTRAIWDYLLGLMNKAGFLRFRPWIARDVELFLKSFELPTGESYDAIHVRRGDKLVEEARKDVVKYWLSQGHRDEDNLPTDYVPFAHYLSKWDGRDACPVDDNGEVEVIKRNVYVATDDPVVVHEEIAALPNHITPNTILWNECHELTFYFNPTDDSAFHLNGDGEGGFEEGREVEGGDSCFGRYHRNIASIADMMILSKARTFIGEFNSNWGRAIRTMRVRLSKPVAQYDGAANGDGSIAMERNIQEVGSFTRTLDTRIAWGSDRARTPGY